MVSAELFLNAKKGFFAIFLLRPIVEISRLGHSTILGLSASDVVGLIIPLTLVVVILLKHPRPIRIRGWLGAFVGLVVFTQVIHGMANLPQLIRVLSPIPFLIFPQIIEWKDKNVLKFIQSVCYSIPLVLLAVVLSRSAHDLLPTGVDIQGMMVGRWGGVFYVPTLMGYWLSIFFLFGFLGSIAASSQRLKRLFLGGSLLLLVPIYWTFSRTAWVSCAVGLLIVLIMSKRYRESFVVLVLAFAINFVFTGVGQRLTSDLQGVGRLVLWIPIATMFWRWDNFDKILGVGWANIDGHLLHFLPSSWPIIGVGLTENSFLFILLGAGLLASLSYLFYWLFILRGTKRLAKMQISTISKLFAILAFALTSMMLLQGLTDDLVTSPVLNWYFYAVAGIVDAMLIQSKVTFSKEKSTI